MGLEGNDNDIKGQVKPLLLGTVYEPRVDETGTGHVFGSPTGDYMGLTCFSNGSLARASALFEGLPRAVLQAPAGDVPADGRLVLGASVVGVAVGEVADAGIDETAHHRLGRELHE